MGELARGSVGDRPWGRTLAALGLRAVTGQLTLLSDGKHFLVAFEQGAVVAAASPLASDAAVRVALTSHLVSSSQVPEISRRQAATPERDEIDVIAELARLGPDHALRLRRRVIAQRAARTFSINHGEFLVTDETELHVLRGCELDIRAIIYMGARANLPEQRLASELDQLGGWFRLKPATDDDLPQFGFTDIEQPVVERLRDGGTLAELEDFAASFVDARTVRAVVYALAAYNACEVGPAPPGALARRVEASSPGMVATQPMPRITAPGAPLAHSVPRPFTQPIPRTVTPPGSPPLAGARTMTPLPVPGARTMTAPAVAGARTVTPPAGPSRTVTPSRAAARATAGAQQTEPMTTFPAAEGAALGASARATAGALPTEPLTALSDEPLPGEAPDARRARRSSVVDESGEAVGRARRSSAPDEQGEAAGRARRSPAPDEPPAAADARRARRNSGPEAEPAMRFDPPTQRDPLEQVPSDPAVREAPRPRRLSELAAPRDGSSPGLSRPIEQPRDRATPTPPLERLARTQPPDGSSPNLPRPLEAARRERGSPGLSRPLDEPRARPTPSLRFATDDAGGGSNYTAEPPAREGSNPRLRQAIEDARAAQLAQRPPTEDPRDGASHWQPDAGGAWAEPADEDNSARQPDMGGAWAEPAGEEDGARQPDTGGAWAEPAAADDAWESGTDPGIEGGYALVREAPTHRDMAALGYSVEDDEAAQVSSRPPRHGGSHPALRPPPDDTRRSGAVPALRSSADARRGDSNPALRPPPDDTRRSGAVPALRSADDARRGHAPAVRTDDARRGDSNPALRPPAVRTDDARRGDSNPALRPPPDDAYGADAGARDSAPAEASHGPPGAGLLIRRVTSSRPPPARQVARTDTAQSHQVKALIAQRLTLLDKGADHFQLIGVAQDASPDALRKAYFALARQLHPDRLAALGISDDGKHAQRLFAQINAGFAILSDPARREPYVSVLRRGGEAAIRAEQAKAEELARQIVDAEEAFHRGELALRRDQPQAAVAELERAIQLNPEEADYHALLAWSQFCAAPDKMAVASATRGALDRAILRSPRAVTARFYLGRVERMLGRDQDALRHFREVLEHAPNHTEAASELRVIESRLSGGRKK